MNHCTSEDNVTAVIESDTDILILMVHEFASRLPDHDWFLQTKKSKFVNVSKIHDYIGNALGITLSAMLVFTGFNTVIYFYCKFKKAILEWVLQQTVLALSFRHI